ncbi:hypothetical protein TSMEX_007988 [Taenia solium]|eukprot:TsM_000881600 transcript=TsM_000881600 gene=TsM_000881600
MDSVEQALSDYYSYEKERMQELIKMELNLWQECTTFAERIELWGKYSSSQMNHSIGRIYSQDFDLTEGKNILPEVSALQNYLAKSGGRTGGWHDFDHQTFLKIRRRYTYKPSNGLDPFAKRMLPDDLKDKFVQEVASALCLTSQSEAFAHEEWFAKLQQLEAASNRALRERRSRQAGTLSARLSCVPKSVTKTRLQSAPSPNRQRQRTRMDACGESKHHVTGQRLVVEQKAKEEQCLREMKKPQKRIQELRTQLEVFHSKIETMDVIQARRGSIHYNVERAMRQCLTELVKERIQERNAARALGYTKLWELRVQALRNKAKSP